MNIIYNKNRIINKWHIFGISIFIFSFVLSIALLTISTYSAKKINIKYFEKKNHIKNIYLTFDDGPTNNTYKILDILDKYDAKATFFFVASKLSTYRKKIKVMVLALTASHI